MAKLSVRDVDVRGKRVLTRVDFNVPIKENGDQIEITDDTRIREALATINYLREQKAKTILMSHFGRPKGKRVQKYSLRPVGDHLHTLIGQPVIFSHDVIGEVPKKIVAAMKDGDVALLQNLRFHPGEEANDPKFASALAEFGDVYVDDAFGAAHTLRPPSVILHRLCRTLPVRRRNRRRRAAQKALRAGCSDRGSPTGFAAEGHGRVLQCRAVATR